jgi:RimJ/RimL family protein N-acetyltransferase
MNTPILKTARLMLSPPLMHPNMNVDHYLRWLSSRNVVQYSEQRHREHTVDSQREYLSQFNVGTLPFRAMLWEIQRTGCAIGSITATIDVYNKSANVAIMIGEPKVWGNGYGAEAFDAVTNYLFEDGIRKVEAGCMRSNSSMRAVLGKCQFVLEATLPNYFLLDGKPEDMLYYGKYQEAKIIPIRRG